MVENEGFDISLKLIIRIRYRNSRERERERERADNATKPSDNPILINTTCLPCQGNCGNLKLVEIHSSSGNPETKYIIHENCYQQNETHYTCADCQAKKW